MQFQPYGMHLLNLNPVGQANHLNSIFQGMTPTALPKALPSLSLNSDGFIGQYGAHLSSLIPPKQANPHLNSISPGIIPFALPRPLPSFSINKGSFVGSYGTHLPGLNLDSSHFPVYRDLNPLVPPIIPPNFIPSARIEGHLQHSPFSPSEFSTQPLPFEEEVPAIKVATTTPSTEERIQKLEKTIQDLQKISAQHRFWSRKRRALNGAAEDLDNAKKAHSEKKYNLTAHHLDYAEVALNKAEKKLSNKKKTEEPSIQK